MAKKYLKFNTSFFLALVIFHLVFVQVSFAGTIKIAVIKSRDIPSYDTALQGFKDLVTEEGVDLAISSYCIKRISEYNTEKEGIIEEIKSLQPDLILTFGSLATRAAQAIKKKPVIFTMVLAPVDSGFVKSMELPGNNFTGVSMDISLQVQFKTIKSILPGAKRIGVIYADESAEIVTEAKKVAKMMGLSLVTEAIASEKEIPKALKNIRSKIDLLWSIPDSIVFTPHSTRFILLFTLREKLPFMGISPSFVKAGALFSLYNESYDMGRQTGEIVLEVLRGRRPFKIPVMSPRKNNLIINSQVAEIIGIKIPQKIGDKADKILEEK